MLQHIALTNYRNLNLEVDLEQVNFIAAPNGAGKSNFLESIYYVNHGRSFRTMDEHRDVIGPQQDFAKVELQFESDNINLVVSYDQRLSRRYQLNHVGKRQKQVVNRQNVLLFSPTTVDIVAGEPAIRRQDLDDVLGQTEIEHYDNLVAYSKLLKNRNAVLKMKRDGKSVDQELRLFTDRLLNLAELMWNYRLEYFKFANKQTAGISNTLYDLLDGDLSIEYLTQFSDNGQDLGEWVDLLASKFEQNKQKEVILGRTLYGPHKDDYQFILNNKDLRYMGSRGQQRLAGLIWKLAQLAMLQKQRSQVETVFLVDDVMSELDAHHRNNVAQVLNTIDCQMIVTTAERDELPKSLSSVGRQISLAHL